MTPAEKVLTKIHTPHGWLALSKDECVALSDQIDDLLETLDSVSILLYRLTNYLPEDTYPSKLVKDALAKINNHWQTFLPTDYLI